MHSHDNKPWPTSSVGLNALLVYGGLFFALPLAVVGLFWLVEQTGPVTAVLIGIGLALAMLGVCAMYLRTHGNRTAGSA